MPGLYLTAGMDLNISGIKIPLDGSESPPVTATVRLDTWQHWLLVACDNVVLASAEEEKLHAAIAADDAAKGVALEAEFRPSMTALSACAFAIDAFYGTVVERFGSHPDHATWRKNRLARHKQIAETLRYRLKLKPTGMPTVRGFLRELFRFRDRAVHPEAKLSHPVYRADMDAAVEPRFVTFSAAHARQALGLTVELFVGMVPRVEAAAEGEVAKWAVFMAEQVEVVRWRAAQVPGVNVPAAIEAVPSYFPLKKLVVGDGHRRAP